MAYLKKNPEAQKELQARKNNSNFVEKRSWTRYINTCQVFAYEAN